MQQISYHALFLFFGALASYPVDGQGDNEGSDDGEEDGNELYYHICMLNSFSGIIKLDTLYMATEAMHSHKILSPGIFHYHSPDFTCVCLSVIIISQESVNIFQFPFTKKSPHKKDRTD